MVEVRYMTKRGFDHKDSEGLVPEMGVTVTSKYSFTNETKPMQSITILADPHTQ